ncbi:hypothetical protein [Crenalkalicoccus roseus]|uniref:hypothetical protein n=1 Tax=Crenalkalicoccus roseus TaxID=1485588 RepID=UPI00108002E5|nr:hypothetical protein [Crenalkalicoccus roseus]
MANPVMSMWLSAANAWAGAMRGFWTAELHRQQTAMMNEMLRQGMAFWSGAWLAGARSPERPRLSVIEAQRRRPG